MKNPQKLPPWIRGRISWHENFKKVQEILRESNLKTVCVEASCPNRGECWENKHVTFILLGKTCTRGCLFCDVSKGKPEEPGVSEPREIAKAVKKLGTKYIVITSVTRDDLPDGGAGHFVNTVKEIRTVGQRHAFAVTIELLIPDFNANPELIKDIAFSGAEIIGHNIEMPESLYPTIRPKADYARSLEVLKFLNKLKNQGAKIQTKSSIIVGVGETREEIYSTLNDLKDSGVDIVHICQYLSPSKKHWPVKKYYTPREFTLFQKKALQIGLPKVSSAPMIRSSSRQQ
ncbi:MAG: lipoyl synthase [Candidatus Omnitrophota bacterium]